MSKVILSIDPGLTGALVWMINGVIVKIEDIPTMAKLVGKGNQVNPIAFAQMIAGNLPTMAYVEAVHSMPSQGVASSFQFGHGVGIIHGVLAANIIPMKLVTPQKWKKYCGLLKKDKDAARSLAITIFPEWGDSLSRKKDGGRADAICIGHYAYSLEK